MSTLPEHTIAENRNVISSARSHALISRNVDSMDDENEMRSGMLGRLLRDMKPKKDSCSDDMWGDNREQMKPHSRGAEPMEKTDRKIQLSSETVLCNESATNKISSQSTSPAAVAESITSPIAPFRTKDRTIKVDVEEENRSGIIGKFLSSTATKETTFNISDPSPSKETSGIENGVSEKRERNVLESKLPKMDINAIVEEKREGMLGRWLDKEKSEHIQLGENHVREQYEPNFIEKVPNERLETMQPNAAKVHAVDASVKIVKEEQPVMKGESQSLIESPRSGILGKLLEHQKMKSSSPISFHLSEAQVERQRSSDASPRSGILAMMLAGAGDVPPNRLGKRSSRSHRGSLVAEAEDAFPEITKRRDLFVSRSFPSCESEGPDEFRRDSKVSIDEHTLASEPSAKLLDLAKKGEWDVVMELLKSDQRFDLSLADSHGFNVLLLAVKDSKVGIFNKLLAYGADLYAATKDRRSVAHIAAMYGNEEMVTCILQKKVDLTRSAGPHGQLPIHYACCRTSSRGYRIACLLLQQRDQRLSEDRDKCLPIQCAINSNNLPLIKKLLEKNAEQQIKHVDANGDTLLHLACRKGENEVLQMIVDLGGTDVNATNAMGWTPLHEVANNGDEGALRIMYKLRADANILDKEDRTPLHVAAERGHTRVVETLIDKFNGSIRARTRDGSTLLHVAALSGHAETALAFLKRGVPLYMPNKRGALGLHSAAAAGFTDVVRMLITRGTNVDIRTRDNYTALHVAVQSGRASVVETLLGFGADVHVVGGQLGETALHIAASLTTEDATQCAVMLLKSGAQPNVTRSDGETPLHIAARNPLPSMIRLLLSEGADPKLTSHTGESALHVAARSCNSEAARLMLEHLLKTLSPAEIKEFVNARTFETGESALHVAARSCNSEAARLMLEHLLKTLSPAEIKEFVNARTFEDGLTAVHYAAEITHEQLHSPGEDGRLINTLIDYGGLPEIQTISTLETAMHFAARSGNETVLLAMVAKIGAGAVQIVQNKQSKSGWSPLLEACARGHSGVARILLKHHARIDVFDESGRTALHLAAANGHLQLTHLLLQHKAFVNSKSKAGEAPLHLAAQNGHVKVVNLLVQDHGAALEAITLDNQTALHFAAKHGQLAVSQTLLALGANPNARDDKGQTPLHLAAENDFPDVVKLFLKMKQNNRGVLTAVDLNGFTCAHIAAMKGSLAVVKELMMIDKAMVIQAKTKTMEATTLHMAVSLTIKVHHKCSMGAHSLNRSSFPSSLCRFFSFVVVVGFVPLCFAAAHNHIDCLRFLLKQKHDTHALMEDRKFIFDLMVCGKGADNEPLKEFILQSPAPIDTAVKLSSLYRDMSEKEKERAKDLSNVSVFAEEMAVELLSITASEYNAALLLKAKDNRGRPLLDVLIENEQKEVVSYASVQRYLTEIWTGRVDWSFGKTVAFALVVFLCPPAWFYFSLPLDSRIGRAPIIKFVCHIVSHVYFTMLLTVVVLNLTHKIYEVTSIIPNPVEWLLLLWLSGNLVSELSNVGGGSGLGIVKVLILVLSATAIAVHILAFMLPALFMEHLDNDERLHFARTMLYLKNQLFAFALLFAFVEFLDFLTVHHLFGPWAIIIRDLMYDLTRFLVILLLFIAGFTLHVTSIFQPAYQPVDEDSADLMRLSSPEQTLEMLFFSLFGLVEPDTMPPLHLVPDFAKIILKVLFGIYLLVTLIVLINLLIAMMSDTYQRIQAKAGCSNADGQSDFGVLINLLIAMMSDTYQRIQAQSDKEWKFGRAILIRQMNKRSATPAPINMLTKLIAVLRVAYRNKLRVCTQKAQQDLRYEEDIDAFSMNGDGGRVSPGLRRTGDENEICENEELGKSANWSIETVIDWKRIVEMYYQANVRVCTQKAQQDLRYEEDIDAFSMNGDGGRVSPGLRRTGDENEICENEELGKSANWSIETVIDWKRIVEMYYQANGAVNTEDVHVEMPS
ncbi:Ankyrin-2 [Toxocara canis]|uniref:Ankyrin-2 n=1 Tax=Toxocara canis TaxID=6265 RepID=A0A0B2UZ79_TOXCA|nr:Ankyrin-2 [Toxocara canis]